MPITVYLKDHFCSCRACGLEWRALRLEPCPRCNEGSLHAEAVKLLDERDRARRLAQLFWTLIKKIMGNLEAARLAVDEVEEVLRK